MYIFVTFLSIPNPFKIFPSCTPFHFPILQYAATPLHTAIPFFSTAPFSYPVLPLRNIHSFTASNSALWQDLTKQAPQKCREPLYKSKWRHNPDHKNLYELPCSNSELLFYQALDQNVCFWFHHPQTSGLRHFGLLLTLTKKPESSVTLEQKLRYFNTLRTGDANLRFYITTVQEG